MDGAPVKIIFLVIARQSRQRGPLPYEDNEPSRSLGRLLLLSIPDLIRDPGGREFIQRIGRLPEVI
jgi:hypothetical protein